MTSSSHQSSRGISCLHFLVQRLIAYLVVIHASSGAGSSLSQRQHAFVPSLCVDRLSTLQAQRLDFSSPLFFRGESGKQRVLRRATIMVLGQASTSSSDPGAPVSNATATLKVPPRSCQPSAINITADNFLAATVQSSAPHPISLPWRRWDTARPGLRVWPWAPWSGPRPNRSAIASSTFFPSMSPDLALRRRPGIPEPEPVWSEIQEFQDARPPLADARAKFQTRTLDEGRADKDTRTTPTARGQVGDTLPKNLMKYKDARKLMQALEPYSLRCSPT